MRLIDMHCDTIWMLMRQKQEKLQHNPFCVDVEKLNVDLLSLSSHKINGPKGVGALYIKKGTRVVPLIHGGGQEKGIRAGTENVPGIVGFGKACELAVSKLDEHYEKLSSIRDELIDKVLNAIPESYLNGDKENRLPNQAVNVIPIDSIYTPIVNVKYVSENFRVEQKTDYEKLTIEIDTDGSIHPKEALKEAATILIQHFMLFSDEKISLEVEKSQMNEEFDENTLHIRQLLKTKLTDMDLSVRALNCLKTAEVETLGELVAYNKADLLKFRNFGKKSLAELEDLVASKNLDFGMNIAKYKLDKE